MKKKNPIIAILLTIIFAMAPFGAVANALTWNEIETEITNLRSNPVAVSHYAVASATDQDVAQAIKRGPEEFNNMHET